MDKTEKQIIETAEVTMSEQKSNGDSGLVEIEFDYETVQDGYVIYADGERMSPYELCKVLSDLQRAVSGIAYVSRVLNDAQENVCAIS